MAGLSGIFLDYQGPLTGNFGQYKTFDPGITIGAHAYVNSLLNVSLNSAFVPETVYPLAANDLVNTSIIDVNALAQFKSNGTLFPEEAIFAPYLVAGFGMNTASNNIRMYIPVGLGIRLQINKNFNLEFQGVYKQKFGKEQYQHIAYTAGFVFALPTARKYERPTPKPTDKKIPPPAVASNETLVDSDGDGVFDRDDLCPDVKGMALYLGCPEEAKTEKPEPIAVKPEPQPEPVAATPLIDDLNTTDNQPIVFDEQPIAQVEEKISQKDLDYIELAMNNVYFESASDKLTYESLAVLDTISMIMERYPQHDLQVMGHTDATGSGNKNLILSIKRAFRVKYYLVYEKGIKLARITSDGYSSVAPLSDNETEAGRRMNRRVEFKLVQSSSDRVGFRNNR